MRLRCRVYSSCVLVIGLAVADAASADRLLWDMRALSRVPPASFGERKGLVQEVYYEGVPLQGKPTRVFAYYAHPDGDGPFPAMVLVHGGGGKAFSDWALHWARRGYAAIAMDLSGNGPNGKLHDGGPDQRDIVKFRPFEENEAHEMWTYHAVAAAIRAHSLLASRPEVDSKRIGVTGISWGGYLTCIIAGVDHRFKAAAPVFGCGYLGENSVWKEPILEKMPAELRERWLRLFDPSQYLGRVRCPILFLNGTNDFAYPMDSYLRSFGAVRAPKTLSVQVRLPHGHIWTYAIVDNFIDSHLRGGARLPVLGPIRRRAGGLEASFSSATPPARAELCYTTDRGRWQQRYWLTAPAKIEEGRITANTPAANVTAYYLAITDAAGNVVTTPHVSTEAR